MFRVGAHVSMSDGFAAAVEREAELGGNCGQLFVGSPRGWAVSDVDDADAEAFRDAADERDVGPWAVHGTYLVNLATPDDDLAAKSLDCLQSELDAAATLGVPYYVFHPGAHTGAGEAAGVENVGDRLSELDVPDGVTVLLENTAGKGTTVGKRLGALDDVVDAAEFGYGDLGVCLDTCHLYAAGYDFTDAASMADLVDEIDATVGRDNVEFLHLNDSKHPLGSEKDEHEHVGDGEIGAEGFRRFINHDALRDKPMVVETPANDKGDAWNVDRVRALRTED
ncbi:deoxyribonuclease IV [Halobaculum sp. D14]|uniref:deoxyribonuclease IV n=1 Tax=Halobaculum sp. D14 TaxID=3421642 RepID=UPI003EBD2A53